MGSRMAANLLKTGNTLFVWNRSPGKSKSACRCRGDLSGNAGRRGPRGDVLFTMLSVPEAVKSAALGPEGFLGSLAKGSLWVDCSTVGPAVSRQMAGEAARLGAGFLDAPVTGSLPVAEKAELTFLVGGEAKDLERCRPLLAAMGKTIRHAGGVGAGSSMKLVVNLLLANAMGAFSEAIALGESLGFSRSSLLDALIGTPVSAPFLAGKKQKLVEESFDPEFPLRLMYKDLQLVSTAAYELGVPLPITHATKELFGMATAGGLADRDFSGVSEVLKKKRGGAS